MAPPQRLCEICGQRFFAASLPFHQKACAKRNQLYEVECVACRLVLPSSQMGAHIRTCAAVRQPPTPQQQSSPSSPADERAIRGSGGGGPAADADASPPPRLDGTTGPVVPECASPSDASAPSSPPRARTGDGDDERRGAEGDDDPDGPRPPASPIVRRPAPSSPFAEASPSPTPANSFTLAPCRICRRTFAPDRLEAHQRICASLKQAHTLRR